MPYTCVVFQTFAHLVTHRVWPHQPKKKHREGPGLDRSVHRARRMWFGRVVYAKRKVSPSDPEVTTTTATSPLRSTARYESSVI